MTEPRKERKVVTVVFADLVGFTARAETLDPEDVEAILRPYHERLRAELERYGGTVEKFIGDAVEAMTEHREHSATQGAVLFWLATAGDELRLQHEIAEFFGEIPDTPQAAAAHALLAGDWKSALAFFEPDFGVPATRTRLVAARRLVAAGRRAEADEYLQGAITFATKAGATRMLREAESLLRESA